MWNFIIYIIHYIIFIIYIIIFIYYDLSQIVVLLQNNENYLQKRKIYW